MLPRAFDASWREIAPGLTATVAAGQLAAARSAVEYVPAVLSEIGQPDEPDARVLPAAFAGVASDGRSLVSLLEGSVRIAKRAASNGATPEDALALGGRWLDGVVQTIATDAARDAVAAEVIVREGMGWVRAINPPCCSRCAVLAGRWYSWKADFARHPRCDCYAIPTAENVAGDFTTDPQELVGRGLVTDLSAAQKSRLDDGADLVRVLNESRDRWRERMAAQRRAEKDARGRNYPAQNTGTVHDFMAQLTNRVDAVNAMRAAGIVD